MRKIALVCMLALGAALAATSSQARRSSPDDGCLVVQSGKGIVTISAKGFIFGRLDQGTVDIDDPIEGDGKAKIFGAIDKTRLLTDTRTRYVGSNLRFRASGLFRITVNGVFMDISAAGKGTATLSADDLLDAGTFSVDAATFCDSGFQPMPDVVKRYVISGQTTA